MQSPPFPRYLFAPRSKYSPQHHVLKHPQFWSLLIPEILVLIKMNEELHELVKVKVKQSLHSPVQALRFPAVWGSQISRQSANEGVKFVSPTHRLPLPPWYSHLLQAESTSGSQCSRKDYVNEKFQWHPRGIDHPACSAVPRPTAPSRAPSLVGGVFISNDR